MQFPDNRVIFLYPNLLIYMEEILLQFWNLKKYFSFLQSYGYINNLCHIFNFARNNQQQLVIFIVKKHWLLLQIQNWQVDHFSACSMFKPPAFPTQTSMNVGWLLREQRSPSTSWFLRASFGGKGRLHFIPDTAKVNAKLYVETFYQNLFKIADLFCDLASSFNRTARLYTRQSWLKIGLLPTAVNSLVKVNGLRTRLTSTLWTTMSGELCLNATSHFNPSRRTSMSSRKLCSWYGTSCHRTSSTKPEFCPVGYFNSSHLVCLPLD